MRFPYDDDQHTPPSRFSRVNPKTIKRPLGYSPELIRRREQRLQQQEQRWQQEEAATETVYEPRMVRTEKADTPPRRPKTWLWGLFAFFSLAVILALGYVLAPQLLGIRWQGLPNFAFANGRLLMLDEARLQDYMASRRYMTGGMIYPGVYVDQVGVGDLTRAQAEQAVLQVSADHPKQFAVTVEIGDQSWLISSDQVPIGRDAAEQVRHAWAQGRMNSASLRGSGVTPFQERLNAAVQLRSSPVSFSTTESYPTAAIRAMTDEIVRQVAKEPVSASVASFDFNTRSFSFTEDQPGQEVDAEDLYTRVIDLLNSGSTTATLKVQPIQLIAPVTKAELMSSFRRVSSFSTKTTKNKNRNTNVRLSAEAINGRTVLPGETFSFNKATGERTAEKGYLPAAAIAGGQVNDEVGGGVCQTSSTLFNAIARADLEVVKRSPHAWPSNYVEKGMDATVNWPNLDFVFRNTSDWPIFILASYADRTVTVEIYGRTLGDDVAIDLESQVVETIKPPEGIKFVANDRLPAGSTRQTVKARTGYVVDTQKVWYQNGKEIRREHLFTSTYKAYQETVEFN